MSKKKTRKNAMKEFNSKEKLLAVIVFILYAFSLVMDGLLTAFVLWPMEKDMFFGAYGGYMILGSGLVGLITVYFACLTTKKSEKVRGLVTPCIVTRGALLLVLDIVLMIINPTWSIANGERAVGAGVFSITLLGGIFFGIQILLCGWIASELYYPSTPYNPLTPYTPSDKPTESYSNGDIIVTSSVENTEYYKNKRDEEYRKLMGYPPKDDSKTDYSDLDSHDYSHIFKDKNY